MRKAALFIGLSAATIFICAIGFQQRRVYAQSQYNVLQYQLYPSFQYNTLKYPTGLAMVNGALLIADSGNHVIRSFNSGSLGVWAGAVGASGYVDGPPATARFNHPASISVYEDYGVLYVFINDTKNYVVRLHTMAFGYNQVGTLAGVGGSSGFVDGKGSSARFSYPGGIATSSNPLQTFMCDVGNHAIRQVYTDGTTSTYAGNGSPGLVDGYRTSAQFNCPAKVALDSAGNMYVADAGNNAIRKIDTSGNVTTLAGAGLQGYADGSGSSAQFDMPCAIVFNPADNSLYVSDSLNSVIRKITLDGVVSTYAGSSQGQGGLVDGSLTQAKFECPMDLLISNGIMYVADAGNNAIRSIDMVNGVVSTYVD
jgi:hypothetical protein